MDFRNTGRIRDLFKKISKELVHDGDMFAIVSTGPSSIAIDATYDRKRLDEAINKISGQRPEAGRDHLDARRLAGAARGPLPRARRVLHGLRRPAEDGVGPQPAQGVHLRQQRLRLRSVLEVARQGIEPALLADAGEQLRRQRQQPEPEPRRPIPFSKGGNEFAAADLASELSELTREANRANTAIYTIDPRGLVGGPDLDETKLDMVDWQDHIRETQSSLA
jgi:hypothetical protein